MPKDARCAERGLPGILPAAGFRSGYLARPRVVRIPPGAAAGEAQGPHGWASPPCCFPEKVRPPAAEGCCGSPPPARALGPGRRARALARRVPPPAAQGPQHEAYACESSEGLNLGAGEEEGGSQPVRRRRAGGEG